ncbi:hypothetical protein ABG79_01240 [Caloramator mitchellensis]|uniref:Flagellar protein n=1 Tax=Caloramator mitchellensis TaxID=908809 RepID=A0A0R3JU15_CALMK|nr:flagellar biosynthetic protein FliO [Caloramator mitchellensis]KRQ87047.1 hypothetical protein ABG79_01240 [Caloramator mitchellensis]
MERNFIVGFIKIIILLPAVLLLIYISFKYGGKYLSNMNNGRLIKVYERVPLSQSSFISVVTIAGKPYIVSNTNNEIKILLELDEEKLEIYKNQNANTEIKNLFELFDIKKLKGKMKNEKI